MQLFFRDFRRVAFVVLLLVLLYQAFTPVASSGEIVIQPGPTLAANRARWVLPPAPEPIELAQNVPQAASDAQDANLPVIIPQPVRRPTYSEVYQSIPFRRSEYRANPSYRHDATMEIMFGQLRQMSINRYYQRPPQTERYRVTYPYLYPPNLYYPFAYPRPNLYRRY